MPFQQFSDVSFLSKFYNMKDHKFPWPGRNSSGFIMWDKCDGGRGSETTNTGK